jgi:hypothetical protein
VQIHLETVVVVQVAELFKRVAEVVARAKAQLSTRLHLVVSVVSVEIFEQFHTPVVTVENKH